MSQHQTNIANLLREIVAYCREAGHEWSNLAEAEAALTTAQAKQSIDAEALIRAVLPGGSSCDPQTVADEIRRYLGQWPGQASTFAEIIEAASPTPPAQQPEAVPSGLHEKDIYDFAGWLTSRPGVMEVGCTSWACPMADAVVEYIKTFPQRFAPAQQPAGDVVMDAERWRYALESDDFAVCKWETIFGEEGWFPISETSEIDAALASSARKGE